MNGIRMKDQDRGEISDEATSGLRDLKGTKVYLPEEQIVRERISDTLKTHFKLYGYRPLETPILELYDIAASKYGGGAEILKETYRLNDQGKRDLCLRYELTFKLGKLIGMNPNLRLPFKRYEIGRVFRDGPIKLGRLREFTQCDVDVVGVRSLVADAELISMAFQIFPELKLDTYIEINNRKLLFGIFEHCGMKEDRYTDAALSLDKLVKYGESTVRKELNGKDFDKEAIEGVFEILNGTNSKKTNEEKIEFLEGRLTNQLSKEGLSELRQILSYCKTMHVNGDLRFVPTLARGLGYYTGPMWEVFMKNSAITSSIAAGGRWDKMISQFLGTDREFPATGMTFGLDVIFAAIEEQKRVGTEMPKNARVPAVLIAPIDTLDQCIALASQLRKEKISCDIALDKKLSKSLEFANKENIPYVVIVGQQELKTDSVNLREMSTGKSEQVSIKSLSDKVKQNLETA